jgi:hypothetical protein
VEELRRHIYILAYSRTETCIGMHGFLSSWLGCAGLDRAGLDRGIFGDTYIVVKLL